MSVRSESRGEDELPLPRDLEFGFATSSWQIEGSVATRGPSIWDDFARRPGAIRGGLTGEPAADHIRRLDQDLDLLSWLGVDSYRFSVSWPRIMPKGRGDTAAHGMGFYDRLVDGLVSRGIKPVATLYHWDYPAALQEATPWTERRHSASSLAKSGRDISHGAETTPHGLRRCPMAGASWLSANCSFRVRCSSLQGRPMPHPAS